MNAPAPMLEVVPRDAHVLQRTTFETSRALEYFSEKELRAQIGFGMNHWPVAILRELIDNALDAAEGAGVPPEISIATEDDCIIVSDNGPGIPPEIITKSLDYLIRVSNKAYYVSPTRGQMGNALKVIWAAPFVATGTGSVDIQSRGQVHHVEVTLDRIAQRPQINHTVKNANKGNGDLTRLVRSAVGDSYRPSVNSGTSVRIAWTDSTRLLREPELDFSHQVPTAADLIAGFAAFNPHATFILDGKRLDCTLPKWEKWAPDQPTSAHWYTEETLRDLIAAYIARERDGAPEKTVRDFVAEFRGLSGTAKRKAVTAGWSAMRLHDFVCDGDVDSVFVAELLKRMKAESRPAPAQALGKIGEEHLTAWMVANGVAKESVRYVHKAGIDGLPYVLEIAFGVNTSDDSCRRIVAGLNWSPMIGQGDIDPTLRNAIAEARLDRADPVTFVVHIARPRFQFADRGKTRVEL